MSVMKINWGWRIGLLYGGFVIMMVLLVTKSLRQDFDLVAPDYYDREIKYQQVIDAGKNQAALSSAIMITDNGANIILSFPAEFKGKPVTGEVEFYSPVNAEWDRAMALQLTDNNAFIPKSALKNTTYKARINWESEGKKYYQETEVKIK